MSKHRVRPLNAPRDPDWLQAGMLRWSRRAAIAVPLLYFGAQVFAGLGTPGYDWLRGTASDLGATGQPMRAVLNTGAILTGVAFAGGTPFLATRWRHLRVPLPVVLVSTVVLWLGAASCVNAGLFPLPSPRHEGSGLVTAGLLLTPLVLMATSLLERPRSVLRWALVVNALCLIAFGAFAGSRGGVGAFEYEGLAQRVLAAMVFVPVATVAGFSRGSTPQHKGHEIVRSRFEISTERTPP
jgi:hypothetical membrane protein